MYQIHGSGYRYPQFQNGPFLGSEIESATEEEYNNGFDCIPVERKSRDVTCQILMQ